MATVYTIKLPDGGTIDVEGPDGANDTQLIQFAKAELQRRRPDTQYAEPVVQRPKSLASAMVDPSSAAANGRETLGRDPTISGDLSNLFLQGGTLGLSDEMMGVAGAGVDAIVSPFSDKVDFDPAQSYRAYRDRERTRLDYAREDHPWAGGALEFAGGLATLPIGLLKGAATAAAPAVRGVADTLGAIRSGARSGAIGGLVGGFGYGDGAESSVAGAGMGAAAGGALGAAIPAVGEYANKIIGGVRSYVNPTGGVGRQLVGKALASDNITPTAAAEAIQAANQRGVPIALSDLGPNLRGLAGGVSRKPGPARSMVAQAVNERQADQAGRVQNAIVRDLGPVADPFATSDALLAQARAAAKPLYEEAYAAPPIMSPELESLLATPAGKQALSRARTIAANERRDPEAMGFVLNEDGSVALNPTLHLSDEGDLVQNVAREPGYTPQTLDFVKRGLDDVIEANRDPVTRRLNLDEAGRAVNGVRANFVSEVDRLNPSYGKARAAYAGPASARQALDQGVAAVNASDIELRRVLGGLSDADRPQFELGYRSGMSQLLDRRVDGADKASALLGSPRKRQALSEVFGGNQNLGRFLDTMADERAANETYRAVSSGSQTAGRLADDASLEDASILQDVTGAALKGAQGGIPGMMAEAARIIGDARKFGAGKTGDRAREDAAALLTTADPAAFAEAMRKAAREQAKLRAGERGLRRKLVRSGSASGRLAGGVIGANTRSTAD